MLKKENRLSVKTFKPEKTIKTEGFSLKIEIGEGKKFGFIVSKKVDKRASTRNRTKRLYRASVENLIEEIGANKYLLFIIRRQSLNKNQTEIQSDIEGVLKKENLFE